MSSPEVEAFEITDQDLLNEFNPNRPQYRQSKNKATYGVWAEESDEEERPGFSKKDKARKSYATPIGFVSGGVKVGDKVSKQGGDDGIDDSDSDAEYDRQALAGAMAKKGKQRYKPTHGMAGAQGNASIGGWERHTKGVASKLMEKMGYVPGKGLGKNLHGISTPVEAKKRSGKGTVGYHGSERTERSLVDFPTKPDSDVEEEREFRQQLHQWKKGGQAEKKKKPKYIYKTADELLQGGDTVYSRQRGSGDSSQISKVKVIDMTGKEQRVLSGYHAIAHKHDAPREESPPPYSQTQEKKAFDMPELLHNLDLLVEMAEDEIVQCDRKLKHNQDMVINLKHEKEKMDDLCDKEEAHINKLKKVLDIVEECERRSGVACQNAMDLDEYAQVFKHLQDNYFEEYQKYNLCDLATALVLPVMKCDFEAWEPLTQPRHSIDAMGMWKDLLDTTKPQQAGEMNSYERLIWEVWVPHVRKLITSGGWSPRSPDSLLEVLEAWMPLLPEWVMSNVLEQLVLPKLSAEVEAWNPLTDTMPIHGWMHPWLPLMGDRLEPLYAPIRHKLANALNNWHPSDPSAKMILQPWEGVFKKGQMDAFLIKNISPKLALCMQEFVINPSQQSLDAWNWVMAWLDMVPQHAIVTILQKHFFPKWLQILCTWLSSSPNYNEVSKWYMGWKSMFPETLANVPVIKEELSKALSIMNRAVSGQSVNVSVLNPGYMAPPPPPPQATLPQPVIRIVPSSSSVPINFKELLERKAEELGLLFMPIPNRTWEAKQVYKFGSSQIYLDRGVIFILEREGLWVPVSVNTLLDRSRS